MTMAVTGDRGGYNFLERAQQRSPGSLLGQMLTAKQAAQLKTAIGKSLWQAIRIPTICLTSFPLTALT